jgi:hypothetical protein
MIVRRCSQGHRVRIHKNNTPGVTRTKAYQDGTTEALTYPASYDYFVDVDGEISKRTNSFKTAEEFYVSECAKKHDNGHGRIDICKHRLVDSICYNYNEVPK